MSPTIRHKYKYFHSTVQRAKDRRQKFHFCRLPFNVRTRSVKLNLSIGIVSTRKTDPNIFLIAPKSVVIDAEYVKVSYAM